MKKILLSTVAAAMVTSSLMAAASHSDITFGSDVNGTIQDLAVNAAALDVNISNVDDANGSNALKGLYYTPAIGIGKGNLITIKIDNGYIYDVDGNNLYLVDANNTTDSNDSGKLVVAKMTDFKSSADGKGYAEMTFKFEQEVPSGHILPLVEHAESNDTTTIGYENGKLDLRANQGLACAANVRASVINSTDQSGNEFAVANAPVSTTGLTVKRALSIAYDDDGACPTTTCTIALPDETSFGANLAADPTCPTCTPVATPTLVCSADFQINYAAGTKGENVDLSSINYTLTTADITAIASVKGYIGTNEKATATLDGNTYSVDLTATTNGVTNANPTVTTDITVDGTTVIKPRTFDLAVKANTNVDVDTIKSFVTLTEQAQQLGVSYLSANPAYRSFVRVTSTQSATIQAVVTTEDGAVSQRVDVTKADGTPVEIGANGGAAVVEAADILRSAQDAGFTGAGMRFNATLFVKTLGAVDAVAYQTADGSQRYLPVAGATGGAR